MLTRPGVRPPHSFIEHLPKDDTEDVRESEGQSLPSLSLQSDGGSNEWTPGTAQMDKHLNHTHRVNTPASGVGGKAEGPRGHD